MSLWSKRLSRYPLKVKIAGSSPVSDTMAITQIYVCIIAIKHASIAQLVEHLPLKQNVTGSSPVGSTHLTGKLYHDRR